MHMYSLTSCIDPVLVCAECGDGLCEQGEQCTDAQCSSGCRADCPYTLFNCAGNATVTSPCNSRGSCNVLSGVCTCFPGYTGPLCDSCAYGYTRQSGVWCVPTEVTVVSCFNGIHDSNELGVDCGGVCLQQCGVSPSLTPSHSFQASVLVGVLVAVVFLGIAGGTYWIFIRKRDSNSRGTNKIVPASMLQPVPQPSTKPAHVLPVQPDGDAGSNSDEDVDRRQVSDSADAEGEGGGATDDNSSPTAAAAEALVQAMILSANSALLPTEVVTSGDVTASPPQDPVEEAVDEEPIVDDSNDRHTPGPDTEQLPDSNHQDVQREAERRSVPLPSDEGEFVRVGKARNSFVVSSVPFVGAEDVVQVGSVKALSSKREVISTSKGSSDLRRASLVSSEDSREESTQHTAAARKRRLTPLLAVKPVPGRRKSTISPEKVLKTVAPALSPPVGIDKHPLAPADLSYRNTEEEEEL